MLEEYEHFNTLNFYYYVSNIWWAIDLGQNIVWNDKY